MLKMEKHFKNIEDLQNNNDLIREFLLNQKLENYGYDYKSFCQLKNRKNYLIRKLKKNYKILDTSKFYGIFNRLYLYSSNNTLKVGYNVGQSFNEEFITLLECFTNSLKE